jgi:hypothetical protein
VWANCKGDDIIGVAFGGFVFSTTEKNLVLASLIHNNTDTSNTVNNVTIAFIVVEIMSDISASVSVDIVGFESLIWRGFIHLRGLLCKK